MGLPFYAYNIVKTNFLNFRVLKVFRALLKVCDGAFRKLTVKSYYVHKKTPSKMLDRILNVPLFTTLSIEYLTHFFLWQKQLSEGVLKIFAKFSGKRLCRNLFFKKVVKTPTQMLSRKICEILRNTSGGGFCLSGFGLIIVIF